jgi:predicted DNA-binding protein (UPF0251 family)
MGARSSQLWQISQLLGLHPPIEKIPEFRARYPQIAIKYPKLGNDELDEVIRRISEVKSNKLDPLAYYPPVVIPKKPRAKKADRDAEIIRLVNTSRMSYTVIGKRFDISRERVRQIWKESKEQE